MHEFIWLAHIKYRGATVSNLNRNKNERVAVDDHASHLPRRARRASANTSKGLEKTGVSIKD